MLEVSNPDFSTKAQPNNLTYKEPITAKRKAEEHDVEGLKLKKACSTPSPNKSVVGIITRKKKQEVKKVGRGNHLKVLARSAHEKVPVSTVAQEVSLVSILQSIKTQDVTSIAPSSVQMAEEAGLIMPPLPHEDLILELSGC